MAQFLRTLERRINNEYGFHQSDHVKEKLSDKGEAFETAPILQVYADGRAVFPD